MRAETALPVVLLVALTATLPAAAGGAALAPAADADPPGVRAAVDGRATALAGGDGGTSALAGGVAPDAALDGDVAAAGVDGGAAALAGDGDRTVRLEVQLLASGDAAWTVTTYVPIAGPDERASFEALGRDYVNGTANVEVDVALFRTYVEAADAASGRSMTIPDDSVERAWTVENGTGMLRLRFTWTNFAHDEGDRFVVDDAFQTDSGTWLPRLADGQVLVVRPPEGTGFVETPRGKGVTDGALRWEGPETFPEDYFYIEYQADVATPPDTVTPPTETPPGGPVDLPAGAFLLFAVLFGGGAAAYLWVRREPSDDGGPTPARADHPDDGAGADGQVAPGDAGASGGPDAADGAGVEADASADEATSAAAAADGTTAEPTPEDPFAGVDVEMLSDEERVLALLDANGGRMKQARIVTETDWSNAKVSQLLSAMDDAGEIDKLRIGRENLISRPDVEVDSFEE